MLDFLFYSILPFLFILGFCITIHEFGHFLLAKLFGIPVEKFSLGYGPAIIRKKIGETDFRIAYFPLGGYVKMAGEEEGEILKGKNKLSEKQNDNREKPPEETADVNDKTEEIDNNQKSGKLGFYDAPIYKRIFVVFSGPLFNIVSAFIVIVTALVVFGVYVDPHLKLQVQANGFAERSGLQTGDSLISIDGVVIHYWDEFEEVLSQKINSDASLTVERRGNVFSVSIFVNSDSLGLINMVPPDVGVVKIGGPAHKAGLQKGDRILSIDGSKIDSWYDMFDIVSSSREKELIFEWQHYDEIKTASIKPVSRFDPFTKDTVGKIDVVKPMRRIYLSPGRLISTSVKRFSWYLNQTVNIFYQLLIRKVSAKQIGGPIAIFKLSTESAQWGFEFLLQLLVLISINLGIINLFPIPVLDGGHIIIAIIEALRRKRFSRQTRLIIQQIGYALILLLIIFVTFNDITR